MSTPRSLALPTTARRDTVDTAYGPVAVLRAEPTSGGRRAPVLLLPGFTGSKEDFVALLEPLTAHGHPVVAVDQRGQYETVGPEEIDDDVYSLDAFAHEAVAIATAIDGAGAGVHVVGHSFGGLVAQTMVLHDRSRVRSLTLMCSGPGALPAEQHDALATFVTGLPLVGKQVAWKVMRDRTAATRGEATPEVEAFVEERFVRSAAGSLIGIAKILASAPNRADDLAALALATHVLYGEHDDAWPIEVQRSMAEVLGAPVTVVAGAGHSPNVDEPTATADALAAFFSSVEDRTQR